MDFNEKAKAWLSDARERFFSLDLKELDSTLTPEEQAEWNDIYASFRSGTLMRGKVIGSEQLSLSSDSSVESPDDGDEQAIPCLIILPYRVKILLPEPLFWWPTWILSSSQLTVWLAVLWPHALWRSHGCVGKRRRSTGWMKAAS